MDQLRAGNLEAFFNQAAPAWAGVPLGPLAGSRRDESYHSNQPALPYDELLAYYKKQLTYYEGGNPDGRVIGEPVAIGR